MSGQDEALQAALDRAEQFSWLSRRSRFAAFVANVLSGAFAAEAVNIFVLGQAQRAGQDPYWWALGICLAVLLALGAASVHYTVLIRRLRALQLSGQS